MPKSENSFALDFLIWRRNEKKGESDRNKIKGEKCPCVCDSLFAGQTLRSRTICNPHAALNASRSFQISILFSIREKYNFVFYKVDTNKTGHPESRVPEKTSIENMNQLKKNKIFKIHVMKNTLEGRTIEFG